MDARPRSSWYSSHEAGQPVPHLAARHERTPETPDPEMPYSAAHEAFADDLLFAVVEVRIDEGQPLAVIS